MNEEVSFAAKLRRLKQCIGLDEDQDVAALLKMSKGAFSVRKLRGSFPDDKLFVLAAERPELALDVTYVLTGDRSVQGRLRQSIEASSRMLGSMPLNDRKANERLAEIAAEMAVESIELRLSRKDVYEGILEDLDRMSDKSVRLISEVARRIAVSDGEDGRKAPPDTVAPKPAATGEAPPTARHRSKGAKR